ncbi:MAG: hypothetical protein H0V43_04020 [Gemmatimonadales bacterium]|nr:hypothetical protein [Gemmatimonadales bacterium]
MLPPSSLLPGLALGLTLAACGDPSPPTAIVELASSGDTVATGYADVADGAWLGGSRWAIVAPMDVTVGMLDLAGNRVVPLGGEGTKDLGNPATAFVTEDTLHVGDWGLRRTSLWTLDGKLVRTVPSFDGARGALPQARDAAGNFYLALAPRPGPDGSGNRDSAAVIRVSPDLAAFDTVARLAPLDIAEVAAESGRRFERRALSGEDVWGVLPDGSLWVARVYENRVEWRAPDGEWTRGEPLPDRVLEVTRYDREVFYQRFPPELRGTAEQLPFAAVKPPFEAGLTASSGHVWLEKSRAPVDSARRYHEVDRRGRLVREVRVPGPGRIVALGDGVALVAERVPDGTRFIRFPIQPPPAQAAR